MIINDERVCDSQRKDREMGNILILIQRKIRDFSHPVQEVLGNPPRSSAEKMWWLQMGQQSAPLLVTAGCKISHSEQLHAFCCGDT